MSLLSIAVAEDKQRRNARAKVITAAMAATAEHLADAIAIAGSGDRSRRLPVQVPAILIAEGVTID